MRISAFALLLGLFALQAHADVATDIYCFTSGGSKPVRFEFRTYSDAAVKGQVGFVKYAGSKSWIPVVLESSEESVTSKDRPAQNDTVWDEVIKGEVAGAYELEYQGVEVNSMVYRSKKRKMGIDFMADANALLPDGSGCSW